MNLEQSILERVKHYGTFRYNVWKIIRLLNISPDDIHSFIAEFNNENSELRRSYEAGVALGVHQVCEAVKAEAEGGNVLAAEQMERFAENQNVEAVRKELFGI